MTTSEDGPGTQVERTQPAYRAQLTNVNLAEQQRVCYELRLRHHTIREISAMTGLAVGTVHRRITDEIERTVSPFREQYRIMERERLEGISRRILEAMSKPHYLIRDGNVVTVDDEPVEDVMVLLACTDRFMRVQERRARLEGLDAAPKTEADEAKVLPEDIELAKMIAKARERASTQLAALRNQG
ncbi:hypothetical protein AB0425_17370 [Actinosynnema sp. NPDC051121]